MTYEVLRTERPRLGILGASRIVHAAILREAEGLFEVSAVAAREFERADSFARTHGIPRAYGSYGELLSDRSIDVVYNALPASGHVPWSILALEAGKHVLCEKPFALDRREAEACLLAAQKTRRLVMEAHHWRYHPLVAAAEEALLQMGRAQSPPRIEAQFVGGLNNPGDIRLQPELGPGVLMDYGCYTLQWCDWAARCLMGGGAVSGRFAEDDVALTSILASHLVLGAPEIDLAAEVVMGFQSRASTRRDRPVTAQFRCDMQDNTPFRAYVRVTSNDDLVHFENPLSVGGSYLLVQSGGSERRLEPASFTTYRGQLRAFLQALRSGEPPLTSGENTLRTQTLLDDCYLKGGSVTRKDLRESVVLNRS